MNQEQELIFGLRRWLIKGTKYINNRSFDDFIHDEMAFDASCFVVEMISEIATRLKSKIDKYSSQISLEILKNPAELQQNVFFDDNIDMEFMYDFFINEAPKIILVLTNVVYLWKTKK